MGKLNLKSYTQQTKKLYIVSVNGATLPNETTLQNTLNSIYKQSIIQWDVSEGTALSNLAFEGAVMSHGASGIASAYNNDQRSIVNAYAEAVGEALEKDAAYLFFVSEVVDKLVNISGYMPLSYNSGFIYGLPENEIIAHELGHGMFNLYHTFSDKNKIALDGKTQNLMDYTGGTELWHYQWDLIHDPNRFYIAMLQDDEDGAYGGASFTETYFYIKDGEIINNSKLLEYPDFSNILSVPECVAFFNKIKNTNNHVSNLISNSSTGNASFTFGFLSEWQYRSKTYYAQEPISSLTLEQLDNIKIVFNIQFLSNTSSISIAHELFVHALKVFDHIENAYQNYEGNTLVSKLKEAESISYFVSGDGGDLDHSKLLAGEKTVMTAFVKNYLNTLQGSQKTTQFEGYVDDLTKYLYDNPENHQKLINSLGGTSSAEIKIKEYLLRDFPEFTSIINNKFK